MYYFWCQEIILSTFIPNVSSVCLRSLEPCWFLLWSRGVFLKMDQAMKFVQLHHSNLLGMFHFLFLFWLVKLFIIVTLSTASIIWSILITVSTFDNLASRRLGWAITSKVSPADSWAWLIHHVSVFSFSLDREKGN